MITVRKSTERGAANFGWLDSKHTFSFGEFHDPEFMGFGTLRVINEDRVMPGQGFGTHGHRDMEIISYVIDGALAHKDSMGNGAVMQAGEVQRMTAGRGVTHSEFNHSADNEVHFLQIWVLPNEKSLEPGYEQKNFSRDKKLDQLRLVVSPDGRDGALSVNQDVDIYASLMSAGSELTHVFSANRLGWVQVVSGSLTLNGNDIVAGDGAAIEDAESVALLARDDSEILLFDMGR